MDKIRKEKKMEKIKAVITGRLSKPRDQLIDEFAKYGVTIITKMRSDINYLITDTPNSGTRKNQMARSFGTKIVSELEFRMVIKYTNPLLITNTIPIIKLRSRQTEETLTRYLDF